MHRLRRVRARVSRFSNICGVRCAGQMEQFYREERRLFQVALAIQMKTSRRSFENDGSSCVLIFELISKVSHVVQ